MVRIAVQVHRAIEAMRIERTGNMRLYIKSKELLMAKMVVTYVHSNAIMT